MDCNVCDERAKYACAGCQIARYCSAECQDADLVEHEQWCYDHENPELEHLEMLVNACLERIECAHERNKDRMDRRENGEEDVTEDETEEEDVEEPDYEDVDDVIEWLAAELEDPYDLDFVAAKRKKRRGKKRKGLQVIDSKKKRQRRRKRKAAKQLRKAKRDTKWYQFGERGRLRGARRRLRN